MNRTLIKQRLNEARDSLSTVRTGPQAYTGYILDMQDARRLIEAALRELEPKVPRSCNNCIKMPKCEITGGEFDKTGIGYDACWIGRETEQINDPDTRLLDIEKRLYSLEKHE